MKKLLLSLLLGTTISAFDPRRKKTLDKALEAKAEGVMLPVDDIGKKP